MSMISKRSRTLFALTFVLGGLAAANPSFAQTAGGGNGGGNGGANGGGESPVVLMEPITHVNSAYPRRTEDRESCGRHYGYNEVAQTYVGADGMVHFCQVR